ncbi:ISAs1 family transposase [Magnetospirillum molischianum]|uniref:ISAs1 family transposase n=1 Tax=Magnetospirillum molischianum TaxID=1083 RepID=UPI0022875BDF|nr:ISAs1 family transposase [Magnetospirillum molischianum]
MLAAQRQDRDTLLRLTQDPHDLGVREPTLLHPNLLVRKTEKILRPHPLISRGDYRGSPVISAGPAFIQAHLSRLNASFGLSLRRAPAYSSVRFILQGLDADEMERVFRQHAAGLAEPEGKTGTTPSAVAIDGKTLRGSFDAFNDRKAAHVLSAFAVDQRIILGHLAIAEKTNEIPAAQEMISALGLTGRLFTLDAMHCQKNLRGCPEDGQPSAGPGEGQPIHPV